MLILLIGLVFLLFLLLIAAVILLAFKRTRKAGVISTSITAPLFLVVLGVTIFYGAQPATEDYVARANSYSYSEFLNGEVEENESVRIRGEVLSLNGQDVSKGEEFILITDNNEHYLVHHSATDTDWVNNESNTEVYGNFKGISDDGETPVIEALIIE
ncbi:hypothetical protein [Jeotgalibacillus aurantiacus]|uniref:hypothetical protein n=1 Tax=Jeotgalibacillus aurantiacus TaxID=2763266 RepID=UPI001D0BDBB7|nr:hypothetical protein [Jeotgalibacillus aurantiacus]